MIDLLWNDFKNLVDSKNLSPQIVREDTVRINLLMVDSSLTYRTSLRKDEASYTEFDTSYRSLSNLEIVTTNKLSQVDPDTGALSITNNFAPKNFYQRLHEIEFSTATFGGALHDRDIDDNDTGWSSVSFYKDVLGVETKWVPVDQADLDLNCIRTDYHFMPNVDYMIKSGVVTHQEVPSQEVYMWGKMLDVDPALNAMGIFPINVLDGGMAMSFVNARDPVGLKGVNGSMLYYGGVMNSVTNTFVPTGDGLGTNRITFVMRHAAGFKHRFQAIFEIFRA